MLIGTETSDRKYVRYEIIKSREKEKGNGLLGVYIHNLEDQYGYVAKKGANPFDYIYIEPYGKKVYFSQIYPTYDYIHDDGYNKLGDWVEEVAKDAGR